jgi:hypothetical protein
VKVLEVIAALIGLGMGLYLWKFAGAFAEDFERLKPALPSWAFKLAATVAALVFLALPVLLASGLRAAVEGALK